MELDDGLDGLLELADAMCDDPGDPSAAAAAAQPAAAGAGALQQTSAAAAPAEDDDLLLCLADSFVEAEKPTAGSGAAASGAAGETALWCFTLCVGLQDKAAMHSLVT
jgi:hypothetical protein